MPQKEETFQVVINVIKNSMCFKVFTISVNVLKIFMQQFWYTIKKVQGTDSYEFLLANKKCRVDIKVFRKILNIYPRVKGEEFTELQNDDDTLTFLIDLGYKGLLYKYTSMYVDHMSQPWRTLAAIINKCLSGKTIDYRRERKSRRENMPYPRFTKVIINHFLKQHKSLSNLKYQHYHTIKDDDVVSRLKFVRIGEDYQEYRLAIPDVMLNDTIKQSESYQMFIKYSIGHIPPKKSSRSLIVTLENLDPIDDEPMCAAGCVVALTPSSAIIIPKTANEFSIKGSSNSDTDKIMARMDAMTLKRDAQYKELQTHAKKTKPDLNEDDIPMSREEEAKFMKTFSKTRFNNDYHD
nr:hypothetical protein [Tanacetum cinerariifolium]